MNFIVAITLLIALAGEILEIARLENRNHALLDFLAEQALLVRGGHLGQRGRGLIDRLGGFQDLLRRFLGAADHGAEFAGHLGHLRAVETLAMQHRDFLLGAVDGVVDEIEFDLEFFALLDLGAVSLQQDLASLACCGVGSMPPSVATPRCGAAICSRRARNSFMNFTVHRHGIAIGIGRYWRGAEKRFFDTKALAMDRHLENPQPSMHASVVD